ncbi:MAG: alcohol dehydrogenase catalytic domain-containing protein, partial [Chloroflexi bacterium]|nr:alcohol dehydrogenase catalytic domain-containing protein [Chloroflexota bacterium]
MATMYAARFLGEGKLVVEAAPIPPVPTLDDVLLEVEAVGICGTDLHILHVPQS